MLPIRFCCRASADSTAALRCLVSATSFSALPSATFSLCWRTVISCSAFCTCGQQLALGVRHPLDVLDPVDQIGERARPQHVVDVGAVALVGRDQERRQMLLGDPQVSLGDLQPARVLADVGAHLVELRRGAVVRLDGRLQLLVVAVELGLGLRDLRLLVVDPVRVCRTGSGGCGEVRRRQRGRRCDARVKPSKRAVQDRTATAWGGTLPASSDGNSSRVCVLSVSTRRRSFLA